MSLPECKKILHVGDKSYTICNISTLEQKGVADIQRLPFSIRILLENLLRNLDGDIVKEQDVINVLNWGRHPIDEPVMIPFHPARVLMQDFTGVPAVVDLASMRDAVMETGGDPERINPLVPVDLVVDHSVQVDFHGTELAAELNVDLEYKRNIERYKLLKWAQKSFDNFRVVPPGSGICHQVNLEYLAQVVNTLNRDGSTIAFPDTLVGTDSHTTMINGLGVLGWGVGGIEAEAVMLGQPYFMTLPDVIGVNLIGKPASGVTATDIVLHITHILRKEKVVEKFVEFTGQGMKALSLTDRATIANMSPEYGATMGFFPVDENTINYLAMTGRGHLTKFVENYSKECSLFCRGDETIEFTRTVDVDLSEVRPSVAGPYRPQDRIYLTDVKDSFVKEFKSGNNPVNDKQTTITNGSVVIAAITSCTNTSNPSVMVGAGLVAKKAVELGLQVPSFVKTSLSPGSKVVLDYLKSSGLMPYLEKLGFHVAGFGCMTCIGNSGPLCSGVEEAIKANDLKVASVLSGNRNFEARVHQSTKANYLMSPILVVIYALAGRVDIDFDKEPIGYSNITAHDSKDSSINTTQKPVFMKDIFPTESEIQKIVSEHVKEKYFIDQYSTIFKGDKLWQELDVAESKTFQWEKDSLYIRRPPFFEGFKKEPTLPKDIENARPLLMLGDSITTDHISPAGTIRKDYPAGLYLQSHGIKPDDFNSYGSRRGNHEVMMRGTFGNIRIKNRIFEKAGNQSNLANYPNSGSFTLKMPENRVAFVFDAAMEYAKELVPLIVLGGKEYGTGSSRDWAAKGTNLLGIKAVIAQSFERIHRSNLVGMGVLPLIFANNQSYESLGLTGKEIFTISGIESMEPGCILKVKAKKDNGDMLEFDVISRLDNQVDLAYYRNGGILPFVLRQII
ncbi:MAG: aconitate hydratase AcnA [Desulfamplus sp.]|nr:aconitate hydratase AcnA [Desulfamplus sp.]